MNHHLPTHATLGMLLLLTLLTAASAANATSYFHSLSTDEKEEYTSWVTTHSPSYPRHAFMPSAGDQEDGAAIFWNIDGDKVNFALAVRADGWVGFGLSEAGGMIGSDVALFTASDPSLLVDAHVVEDRSSPLTDDCQDWRLEGSPTVENGWMIVEMSRLLNTEDSQDHAIKYDADLWDPPTRVIAAWGNSDIISYHGGKKARNSVRLFANHSNELTEMEALLETLEEESDGHFDVLEDEFDIPAVDTTYQELCRTFDDLNIDLPEGQDMLTMIGAFPVITKETAQFVHHFTVHLQKDCSPESQYLTPRTMLYAWAPGDEGWALPKDVGFPVFDGLNNQAVHVQIHYDNPSFKTGMKDSSGIRVYYTHDERTHRAGMLEVGDPGVALDGENIDEGHTKYEFTCPGACSSSFLEAKERNNESAGVTIILEFLHMHQTGVRMTNEVIRDGEVFHKAVADVYDFSQQGVHHVSQEPYKVLPGDSLRTTCYYKDGNAFGVSSQEEMCIAFIMYYPAKQSDYGHPWSCPHKPWGGDFGTGCSQELAYSSLDSVDDLGRHFGDASGKCVSIPINPPTSTGSDVPMIGQPVPAPGGKPLTIPVQEATKKHTSGAGWAGVLVSFPSVSALLAAVLLG